MAYESGLLKSVAQAQRSLAVHDVVRNLFSVGRHRLRAPFRIMLVPRFRRAPQLGVETRPSARF
jgi:hypothetical protein